MRSRKTSTEVRPMILDSWDAHKQHGEAGDVWLVVLAGGRGTRLQQFIRHITGSGRPKQFCRIVGTRSMLRHTWDRARRIVPPDRIVTVVTAGQESYLDDEASGTVPRGVLVQPANKETVPGLLLPLLWIAERDPSVTVVVFPSDHFIWEEERFLGYVRAAVRASRHFANRVVVLGVEADGPEQSYGWIAPGPPCEADVGAELYHFSRTLLAEQPESLLALPVRAVYWSDWGDPQRILRTLRRFDRRPAWLPVYARALAQGGDWGSVDID
jgi:mannose-1-phosphate guanylyltransferase